MTTVIGNNIRITDPSEALRDWAKQNMVVPNPEYEKKQRMGFWTGRTPKDLRLYERHGNELVLPFGVLRDILPMIQGTRISTDFHSDTVIDYGTPVPLYDYQQMAVDGMVAAKFGILKSDAGSGKTQMGIAMIKRLGRRALWLCHTADLLKQSRDRAASYMEKDLIGTITEGKVNIGPGVTFATVQTMANLDLPLYRDMWDVVIVDECHRAAGSVTTVTRYQRVLNNLSARHKYGLTATPDRSDGLIKATFSLIGPIVWEVPREAIADKIMKVKVRKIPTETEITDDCQNEDGTINFTGLITHLADDVERNRLIATKLMEEKQHSCLILSDRLAHLERIRDLLPYEMQEKSALISGKMTSKSQKAEREAAIEQMRTGEKQYLFATYSLAKEGLDIKRLDRLFLTTPVKFYSVVVQSIGRIARVCEGKKEPTALDFVDVKIGFCRNAWRTRRHHYRTNNAEVEE